MTESEYSVKLDELDRLLNDPDVPIQPERIWALLEDVACRDVPLGTGASGPGARG